MKKLFIYRKIDGEKSELIRVVQIHHTFIGINKYGQINPLEFKNLSMELEPTMTSYLVTDL